MLMKYFIDKEQAGESPHPSHFHPEILPELESLYSSLTPMLEKRNPFIYIASTGRGEGASTIAWALTYYLSMREKKECLFVDGDVTNPTIRTNGAMPDAGLSDYLQGASEFKLLPFQTEMNNLAAVHSGRLEARYVNLSETRARQFTNEATQYYRAVIFNAQPGFDRYAELWAKMSDSILILASYRKTKRQILDRMLQGFQAANIPITGLLFNKQEHPIPEFFYRRI